MSADPLNLTFFAWGDTHFGYEQRFAGDDLRWDIIEQMRHLPGWPYPEHIGGCVATPAFVVHCGDMVDAGEPAERKLHYYRYFSSRMAFPQHEVLGNHDVAPAVTQQFIETHGGTSYSFDSGGVHCVSLSGTYDEREVGTIPPEQIDFLERDLHGLLPEQRVILFTHSNLEATTNGAEVLAILKTKRTILVVSAHRHKPRVFSLDGIACIDVGQCRNHPIDPPYGRNFYVVRLAGGSLCAHPWRWDLRDWERGQRWADPETVMRRFSLTTSFQDEQ